LGIVACIACHFWPRKEEQNDKKEKQTDEKRFLAFATLDGKDTEQKEASKTNVVDNPKPAPSQAGLVHSDSSDRAQIVGVHSPSHVARVITSDSPSSPSKPMRLSPAHSPTRTTRIVQEPLSPGFVKKSSQSPFSPGSRVQGSTRIIQGASPLTTAQIISAPPLPPPQYSPPTAAYTLRTAGTAGPESVSSPNWRTADISLVQSASVDNLPVAPSAYSVSGAGTAEVNGTYRLARFTTDGAPSWQFSEMVLSRLDGVWRISKSGGQVYYVTAEQALPLPPTSSGWQIASGQQPPPYLAVSS